MSEVEIMGMIGVNRERDSSRGVTVSLFGGGINPADEIPGGIDSEYIAEFSVPYNELHDKGFPSLGCQPCTRAVEPGEDIRAGRWWWESDPDAKECGLHLVVPATK